MQKQSTGGVFSLVKYDPEIDITNNYHSYKQSKELNKSKPKPSTEDLIPYIVKYREWTLNSRKYIQYPSNSRYERQDVLQLQQKLDQALQYRQARQQGICPIKQKLYDELFDELIRQVTIDCPERGLMLMRVRDEAKMTLMVYHTLFESADKFAMEKINCSGEGTEQIQMEKESLQIKKRELEKRKIQLQQKKFSLQNKIIQGQSIESQKREYQLRAITTQHNSLLNFLKLHRQPQSSSNDTQ